MLAMEVYYLVAGAVVAFGFGFLLFRRFADAGVSLSDFSKFQQEYEQCKIALAVSEDRKNGLANEYQRVMMELTLERQKAEQANQALESSRSYYKAQQEKIVEQKQEMEQQEGADMERKSKTKTLVTLYRGSYIGEQCLLAGQDTFDFCAKAVEWCDILCLSARDIVESLSKEELRRVRLAARVRQERMSALIRFSKGVKPGMTLFDGKASKLKQGSMSRH